VIDSIYNDRILLFQSESSLGTVDWENNAGTGKLMRLDYNGNLLIGTTTNLHLLMSAGDGTDPK
jgi:hypothetical protein